MCLLASLLQMNSKSETSFALRQLLHESVMNALSLHRRVFTTAIIETPLPTDTCSAQPSQKPHYPHKHVHHSHHRSPTTLRQPKTYLGHAVSCCDVVLETQVLVSRLLVSVLVLLLKVLVWSSTVDSITGKLNPGWDPSTHKQPRTYLQLNLLHGTAGSLVCLLPEHKSHATHHGPCVHCSRDNTQPGFSLQHVVGCRQSNTMTTWPLSHIHTRGGGY